MTACPGRPLVAEPEPAGQLETDLSAIRDWGAGILVTLVEERELRWLGLQHLGETAEGVGLLWFHMPIADFHAPDAAFEQAWGQHGAFIRRHLIEGGRLVLHCLAGLGRTGTVAARILVELGYVPEEAVSEVRRARPGTIQSDAQLDYVLGQRWRDAL